MSDLVVLKGVAQSFAKHALDTEREVLGYIFTRLSFHDRYDLGFAYWPAQRGSFIQVRSSRRTINTINKILQGDKNLDLIVCHSHPKIYGPSTDDTDMMYGLAEDGIDQFMIFVTDVRERNLTRRLLAYQVGKKEVSRIDYSILNGQRLPQSWRKELTAERKKLETAINKYRI